MKTTVENLMDLVLGSESGSWAVTAQEISPIPDEGLQGDHFASDGFNFESVILTHKEARFQAKTGNPRQEPEVEFVLNFPFLVKNVGEGMPFNIKLQEA